MARLSWAQRLYWRYLSKPAAWREVFLYAIDQPIRSILEIGLGRGDRIRTLFPLCHNAEDSGKLRYAALDPFESGGTNRLSLKEAHRLLSDLGVKAHLIPGDVKSGVVRLAHTVLPSDLVLIDGSWDNGSEDAKIVLQWLPRLCHTGSAVFASREEGGKLTRVPTPVAAAESRVQSRAA